MNNNPDTIIYATIDNQVLRFAVGTGLTNYTIYVSNNDGNDYFYDGSMQYPYKTLSKAVSTALGGNKIYIMAGNYTLSWNANIKISKNLTLIGIGNVKLLRPNARNIFIVEDKGILNIENINFTSATSDFFVEPLIILDSGNLNVKNCNFYDITSQCVIMAKNNEFISFDNVSFNRIRGPAILGFAGNLVINNSKFSNGTMISLPSKYYGNTNPETMNRYLNDLYFYIALSSNITVQNTEFRDNEVGFIGHYTFSVYKNFWNIKGDLGVYYTFLYNSTFENNNLEKYIYPMTGLEIGSVNQYFNNRYSIIECCTFKNNIGHLLFATIVNNTSFVNNTATPYLLRNAQFSELEVNNYPKSLMTFDLINNSYFYGNSYLSTDFEEKVIEANEVYYSTFINNSAAYGGALSNPKEVHYSVFINNTGIYGANDIFVYKGDLNASSNWWGSNQKPNSDRVHVFIGTLTLDDWVIMSLDYKNGSIIASLNNLLDINETIHKFNHTLHSRNVSFSSIENLTVYDSYLINNNAFSKLLNPVSYDFNVYAKIDNQMLSLTIYNNSTQLLIKNMTLYGKDNPFDITLINVNGHKISNQILNIVVYKEDTIYDTFSITTDEDGEVSFNIDYPVGNYNISVYYMGNGYFDKSYAVSLVNISSISTRLTSYNYTYQGKNNKFYAILQDQAGKYVLNQDLSLKIFDSNNKLIATTNVKTGDMGRANVLLSLDIGTYYLKWTYYGNEWYNSSFSESVISIRSIDTVIYLKNATFYGKGNDYEFSFKEASGTLIRGETIILSISKGNESKEYKLITDDNGIASININLEPGNYDVTAKYAGDDVYNSSIASAVLNIQPTYVTFDLNSHSTVPVNGVFTAVLLDMYGKRVYGENVSLDLYEDGFIKSYYSTTDANGEANFKLDMPEGIYFAILNYNGNIWYSQATGASKITITPSVVLNNVYISGNDFIQYYGENKYYIINFNDTNAYSLDGKIIQILISSGDWSKSYEVQSDIFGKVRLQISLEPGVYNITYKYSNEYYNLHGEGSNTIFVYKMPTSILASDLIINYGQTQFYEVKLLNKNGNPLSNLPINITIDNEKYNVVTNQNGIAKILLDLNLGYHNITYSFNNKNYESSNGSSRILVVNSSQTTTKISTNDIEPTENSLFNYYVTLNDLLELPIISSEIVLNITDSNGNIIGVFKKFTNKTGVANFNLNLTYGTYKFNTYYKGNDKYLPSYNTNTIKIKASENVKETILFGNDVKVVNGNNNTNYYIILSTIDGEFIKNQRIEFKIKNNSYYSFTDNSGKAYLNVPLSPGSYRITTIFNGSNNLTTASITNYITVQGEVCYLYSMDIIKSFNNATQYYVALFDANNLPLANKIIKFVVNNEIYERLTNNDGFACFDVELLPGIYNITASYQGTYPDEHITVENTISVLTTILGENKINYGKAYFPITFLDNMDNPLVNTNVYFVVGDIGYKIRTDTNGIGVFDADLKVGNYNLMAVNPISGESKTFNLNIVSTVYASNLVKYYKSSSKFKTKFLDKNGKVLKNTNVKFIINGKAYVVKTDNKGIACINANLKPGKYEIVSFNTKTGEKRTNTINIKTIIISKDKVVKSSKKTNFKVKILNSKGKILKKANVKFKIKGKVYKIKTNKKGFATLNLKLKKGKYSVSISYNGLTVKNKITVK